MIQTINDNHDTLSAVFPSCYPGRENTLRFDKLTIVRKPSMLGYLENPSAAAVDPSLPQYNIANYGYNNSLTMRDWNIICYRAKGWSVELDVTEVVPSGWGEYHWGFPLTAIVSLRNNTFNYSASGSDSTESVAETGEPVVVPTIFEHKEIHIGGFYHHRGAGTEDPHEVNRAIPGGWFSSCGGTRYFHSSETISNFDHIRLRMLNYWNKSSLSGDGTGFTYGATEPGFVETWQGGENFTPGPHYNLDYWAGFTFNHEVQYDYPEAYAEYAYPFVLKLNLGGALPIFTHSTAQTPGTWQFSLCNLPRDHSLYDPTSSNHGYLWDAAGVFESAGGILCLLPPNLTPWTDPASTIGSSYTHTGTYPNALTLDLGFNAHYFTLYRYSRSQDANSTISNINIVLRAVNPFT